MNWILALFIGFILGCIIIFLWLKQYKNEVAMFKNKTVDAELNLIDITKKFNEKNTESTVINEKLIITEINYKIQLEQLDKTKNEFITALKSTIEKLENDLNAIRTKESETSVRLENAKTIFQSQKVTIDEIKKEKEELVQKLKSDFEVVANKILEEKTQKFTEQNKSSLEIILNPFKEQIKQFEEKVDKVYKEENNERITLKTELKNLIEINQKVSLEANNLTRALKGDVKKQGNWGEVILEKILESSGLRKDEEYFLQHLITEENGDKKYPDVIIKLPEEKHIIIDSKVSLIAYEKAVNENDEEKRKIYIKEHLQSIRNHVKGLSEKNYHSSKNINSPEFVLLFLPIESMFSIAIQEDVDLFNFAWEKKTVLVSPSTLLATLKTVESIWKREKQNKFALEIAQEGGKLYDKFADFIEDMEDLQKSIDKSQKTYETAFKKLSSGNNNVFKQIDRLKELGAKANKSIDTKYTDNNSELF